MLSLRLIIDGAVLDGWSWRILREKPVNFDLIFLRIISYNNLFDEDEWINKFEITKNLSYLSRIDSNDLLLLCTHMWECLEPSNFL